MSLRFEDIEAACVRLEGHVVKTPASFPKDFRQRHGAMSISSQKISNLPQLSKKEARSISFCSYRNLSAVAVFLPRRRVITHKAWPIMPKDYPYQPRSSCLRAPPL